MKRLFTTAAVALAAGLLGSAAHAENFTFDLVGMSNVDGVPTGVVDLSGEIYGLTDGISAATDVTVNDPVVGLFGAGPVDLGGGGKFDVVNGEITSDSFKGKFTFAPFFGDELTLKGASGSYSAAVVELGEYGIRKGAVTFTPVASAVPEPSTWALMLAGMAGLGLMVRRSKKGAGPKLNAALSA